MVKIISRKMKQQKKKKLAESKHLEINKPQNEVEIWKTLSLKMKKNW